MRPRSIFAITWVFTLFALSACDGDRQAEAPPTATESPPPRVLVLTPEQYAFGGGTLVESLIEAAGGVNAAHDLNDFSQIADRQILALVPDVILFSQTWTTEQMAAWAAAAVYAELPAIANGRVYQLDFSLADSDLAAHREARIAALRDIIRGQR